MHAQSRPGSPAAGFFNPVAVVLKHPRQALGGRDRALGRQLHPFEEKGEPRFPIAGAAHVVQQLVVGVFCAA